MRYPRRAKRNSPRRNSRRKIKAHRRRTTNHSRYSHEMPAEIRQSTETTPPVDVLQVSDDQILLIERLIQEVFGDKVHDTLNQVVYRIWGRYLWTPDNDEFADEAAQATLDVTSTIGPRQQLSPASSSDDMPSSDNRNEWELGFELSNQDSVIEFLRMENRQLQERVDFLKDRLDDLLSIYNKALSQ
ncbi:hypothetical protein NM208_g10962 [Fusarium decemcellulare]|uniref:Uncharacterized protein n=1 Tax=Fusarium decemcellulare TaxID=57161 RepID=A0ACC1RW41_9HYPO|nr:hypothetical protein NM208_g10962 [Fusarium decemcellulare]